MRIFNPIKISYKNLMAAKFRSFLTILGIIIGVGSVILIMAIGQSAQELLLDQVKGIGSNLVAVLPGASDENGPPAAAMGIAITTFTYEDLEALRNGKNVPELEAAAGYVQGTETVERGNESKSVSFTGTTASYIQVENAEVEKGRFFSEEEEADMARVVVLGQETAQNFFGVEDPLNKKIDIDEKGFLVIGVLKKRGSSGFGASSQDDQVYLPLRTAQKVLMGIDHLGYARLKIKSQDQIPSAISNVKATLRERHDIDNPEEDDFSVRDQASALKLIEQITDVLRYFLLAVGAMSLLVGGVGIMNVMLIAVNQRIREVGLRKAIGAKTSDILWQFVMEASFISFLGGAIGIILGIGTAFLVAIIVQALGYYWPFLVSWQSIVVAAFVSISIGMIFGLYPARKASRVSPMEALRYE
ncbi:MAG: ABC transporter permease [Patescibacteria group bacterium]